MSSGRRRPRSNRNRRGGLPATPTSEDFDDCPLAIWAYFSAKRPRQRKNNNTPQKRRAAPRPAPPPAEVINLEDSVVDQSILENVQTKIGDFMASASFISSDEDERELSEAKPNKKPTPASDLFFISDDSDDDFKPANYTKSKFSFQSSVPSSTAGPSTSTVTSSNSIPSDDDVMVFVDTVLEKTKQNADDTLDTEMKSLEAYSKETEEMLKNASSLFEEIHTGKKPEPPAPKVSEKEPNPSKPSLGSCPICLESLGDRPVVATVCGHLFCKECIMVKNMKKCPTCRKGINAKKIHPIYI